MTDATTKPTYKKTLNLPRTSFPMKANLAQNEPASQKRWAAMDLYHRILDTRAEGDPYVFHDGPPYANGSIHVGHLLNKVLKDFVVRTRSLMGKRCPYVPGWDCHGLPIEHKVMTQLVESGKIEKLNTLSEDDRRMAIRRECRKYAEKYVKLQSVQMQRLLTNADYADPYLTMNPRYERAVLEVFAGLVEKDLVYRALKAVHWSIANQTALAEAELEYEDREDLSVYVDFEAADRDAAAEAFGVELDETPSFMIWTTTPWTLAANLAIAVNEKFTYALVRVDGSVTVLARELVETVTKAAAAEEVEVLGEATGSALVGLGYRHPFCERESSIVAALYVTLEDGTGLVHTAPGHGEDDYNTGLKEGLDIYCPVLPDGTYDETVPQWLQGMDIWEANEKVTEHLRESGHLFFSHRFTHSYPHDWRSKTPVIFRATKQWFVGVDRPASTSEKSLREMGLAVTAGEVEFVPAWGRNRMRGMLESRPDWCLSRQRSWGLPIPAFILPDGEVFLSAATVRAVARVVEEKGSDAWFTEPPAVLLASYDAAGDPDAPEGLDVATLTKTHDIFDVWFESGSSWNAVIRERDLGYPVDLYLEGSDQHRGWFQLSLLPALGITGESPFRTLLTHGFGVDKDGRKMSKSGGNALDVDEALKHYGADVCRWWVSSVAYENDFKVDLEYLKVAGESYRKVRNTLRFLLSNLTDFDPAHKVDVTNLPPDWPDAYVLPATQRLQEQVLAAYEAFEFRRAHQLLYDFCNDTLSAFYCAAVKDRLYCDEPDSPRRRATQAAMWHIMQTLCRLLAPLLPHTADEAYRSLLKDEDACVHLETAYSFDVSPAHADWPKVLAMRDRVLKALEEEKSRGLDNPLDADVSWFRDPREMAVFRESEVADLTGVSRFSFLVRTHEDDRPVVMSLTESPRCDRCWKHTEDTKPAASGEGALCARCQRAVDRAAD